MTLKQRSGGRSARVQRAVFDATVASLIEVGWSNLSIGAIAARAGVHETSIYRRWKTKEKLVVSALLERLKELLPVPDTGSLRDELVTMLRGLLKFLRSPFGAALVRLAVALPDGEQTTALRRTFWGSRFPVLLEPLKRGAERGEIAAEIDHQLVLETLIGVFYLRAFVTGEHLDEDLPERVVSLVLDGAKRENAAGDTPPRTSGRR